MSKSWKYLEILGKIRFMCCKKRCFNWPLVVTKVNSFVNIRNICLESSYS